MNSEPRPTSSGIDRDTRMTATYVRVLVLEAVIFVLLWAFARAFS